MCPALAGDVAVGGGPSTAHVAETGDSDDPIKPSLDSKKPDRTQPQTPRATDRASGWNSGDTSLCYSQAFFLTFDQDEDDDATPGAWPPGTMKSPPAAAVLPAASVASRWRSNQRGTSMTLYNNILVVVDATGNELTRARVTEFVKLNGRSVHLVYLAPEYMVGETLVSMPVSKHADEMQQYIDRLHAEGVEVRGEIMSSNWFGRGDAVLELAHSVSADLIILNTEQGGQRAKAQLAAIVARNSPKIAILIARSTAP